MKPRTLGFIEILASGICFGFLGIFGKIAYQNGLSSFELLSLRFLTSSIILAAGILIFKPQLFRMQNSERWASILLGLFGLSLFSGSYFIALQYLSAPMTALLLYTYPVLVAIGAQFWFGEKLGKLGWAAMAGSLVGLGLLLGGEINVQNPWAIIIGLTSALGYAAYILLSRKFLKTANPWASVFWIQLSAGLCFFFLGSLNGPRVLFLYQEKLFLIFGIAIVSSLMPMILFLRGLQRIKSLEVSILSTSEPVTAILLTSLFLGESLTLIQMIGGICVLMALVLLARRPS